MTSPPGAPASSSVEQREKQHLPHWIMRTHPLKAVMFLPEDEAKETNLIFCGPYTQHFCLNVIGPDQVAQLATASSLSAKVAG